MAKQNNKREIQCRLVLWWKVNENKIEGNRQCREVFFSPNLCRVRHGFVLYILDINCKCVGMIRRKIISLNDALTVSQRFAGNVLLLKQLSSKYAAFHPFIIYPKVIYRVTSYGYSKAKACLCWSNGTWIDQKFHEAGPLFCLSLFHKNKQTNTHGYIFYGMLVKEIVRFYYRNANYQ